MQQLRAELAADRGQRLAGAARRRDRAPGAKPSRASCTSRARAPRGRSSRSSPARCATTTPSRCCSAREANGQVAPGVLEQAGAGTLFINELEDLPPQRAARCCSACSRAGSSRASAAAQPVKFEGARAVVRAARHRDARGGTGSAATCSRISTRSIVRVPPLREYAEDVPELLRHYVDRAGRRRGAAVPHASASPRRTGCATTRGPTTCASSRTSCSAC